MKLDKKRAPRKGNRIRDTLVDILRNPIKTLNRMPQYIHRGTGLQTHAVLALIASVVKEQ